MSSSSSVVSISHPFTAAIHLQKQLDQMISNQSRFQSDITQPEGLDLTIYKQILLNYNIITNLYQLMFFQIWFLFIMTQLITIFQTI